MIDHRIEYQNRLQTLIEKLDVEMWRLRQAAHEADEPAKAAYARRIEELAARQREAREELYVIQEAGDSTWDDIKASVEKAWNNLKDSVGSGFGR